MVIGRVSCEISALLLEKTLRLGRVGSAVLGSVDVFFEQLVLVNRLAAIANAMFMELVVVFLFVLGEVRL